MISKANFVNYISKSNDCAVKNKLHFFPSSIQWWCENLIPYPSHRNGNNMAMIITFTPIDFWCRKS